MDFFCFPIFVFFSLSKTVVAHSRRAIAGPIASRFKKLFFRVMTLLESSAVRGEMGRGGGEGEGGEKREGKIRKNRRKSIVYVSQ